MKKLLLLTTISSLVVFLTACGNGSDSNNSDSEQFNDSIAKTEESIEGKNAPSPDTTTSQPLVTSNQVTTTRSATTTPRITAKQPVVTSRPITTTKSQAYTSNSDYISEVIRLVNIERSKQGLSALSTNSQLANAANIRAKETVTSFSHTRPDGRTFYTVLQETKISYRTCGENIAAGQTTPQEVVKGWMNSEGHRKNILNGSFTKIGVGFVKASTGYKYFWTQLFIG